MLKIFGVLPSVVTLTGCCWVRRKLPGQCRKASGRIRIPSLMQALPYKRRRSSVFSEPECNPNILPGSPKPLHSFSLPICHLLVCAELSQISNPWSSGEAPNTDLSIQDARAMNRDGSRVCRAYCWVRRRKSNEDHMEHGIWVRPPPNT